MGTSGNRPVYAAHTPNTLGEWQSMRAHTLAVAELARRFAQDFGAGELGYCAGLLHDLGKYTSDFQEYLDACHRHALGQGPKPLPGSAPHKQHGAAFAWHRLPSLLSFIILGHHGGMQDVAATKKNAAEHPLDGLQDLIARAGGNCPELLKLPDVAPQVRQFAGSKRKLEMLARMVYSCLVDADALDTEAHRDPNAPANRSRRLPTIQHLRDALISSQAALLAGSPESPLNLLRREVYEACRAAASASPGVYRLTVPTGGGKTRSSLAFALEHAAQHGLCRVIYAIPYTSIVEQTVEVFEGVFGGDAVLEHHSAIEPPEENAQEAELEHEIWRRLAAQNWDAPLVVTTTVQLFESLFGNRPARSRKVHNLARAVIVLDEVQALPPKLLKPIVDALRTLSEQYGTTVLLCTATQPALDQETLERVGFANTPEIAPEPVRLFSELKRVTYDLAPLAEAEGWSWDRAAREMLASPSCLTVVNARKDALALMDALEALGERDALHLSTLLCGRHRRDTLAEIRRRLKENVSCRVVSTQVVECGCDLDFPLVLRALGPLDRIVQAAGRCNREGLRSAEESRVVVFRPAQGRAPKGSYRVAMDVAARLLRSGADLHDPAVYEQYFRQAFAQDDTDARKVLELRDAWNFPRVAEEMRLIDQDTTGVLVRYERAEDEYDTLLEAIRANRNRMNRHLWRRVQPFMVSLARWEFEGFQQKGLVWEVAPDVGLWLWKGAYDPLRGLAEAEIDPTDLIR